MEPTMEYTLMAVLALVIIFALYYYFMMRKTKCDSASDCSSHQTCTDGYCKSKSS